MKNMREWLVTNGLGGYASLTYSNKNTRKYHGLLISSLNPPTERWVFVSNVYDKIKIGDKTFDLGEYMTDFTFDYFPIFQYQIDGVNIKKMIYMEYLKNTTVLKYEIKTDKHFSFLHSPIVNSRHIYDVTEQRNSSFKQEISNNTAFIKPENIDKILKITFNDCKYEPVFYWEEMFYQKDRERNESWVDNNVQIGKIKKDIDTNQKYYIIMTLEDNININPVEIYNREIERKRKLLYQSNLNEKFEKLVLSSDNFIVSKEASKSIIAGYHWFGDWGRDTLISLPGLTLITKRFDDAKEILLNFSRYFSNGLIPNAFMDRNSEPVYNTVDASLWYIDRIYQYLKYTNNLDFLKETWGVLESIIFNYKNGTNFGIHMEKDFLISHNPGLTWMDVKIGDYYSTPRNNKAVEIQGLWYNALMIMSNLSQKIDREDVFYNLSEKVKDSFNQQFDGLYDVIDTKDLALRPNIIFLLSQDYSMIPEAMQEKIIEIVKDKLCTAVGLRTLSPEDSRYKGSYFGNYNKDEAYHNGTIWPWLLGPFVTAFLKIKKYNQVWREFAYRNYIKPLIDLYGPNWDGSIHEIFDGDPTHSPRGCISQAWSVAEILRCWVEDVEYIRPEFERGFLSKISI